MTLHDPRVRGAGSSSRAYRPFAQFFVLLARLLRGAYAEWRARRRRAARPPDIPAHLRADIGLPPYEDDPTVSRDVQNAIFLAMAALK